MLVSSLSAPDNSGRGAGRVKTGVRFVTFMSFSELAMNGRVDFYDTVSLDGEVCVAYATMAKARGNSAHVQ